MWEMVVGMGGDKGIPARPSGSSPLGSTVRFIVMLFAILTLSTASSGVPAVAGLASGSRLLGTWQVLGAARTLPTLYRPTGLALDGSGNVYVADAGNFRVVEINSRGQLVAHFGEADLRPGPGAPATPSGEVPAGPHSLAVDGSGTVYVADAANRYVRVFSPQHHLVADWPITMAGTTILDMAVATGARGNIIVAIAAQVSCAVPGGPSYCATYYVVQRRSPAGALLSAFHSPIGPSGMNASPPVIHQIAAAVDSRGNIYVTGRGVLACYKSCPTFHFLSKYTPDGKLVAQWGMHDLGTGAGWPALAIDVRGNIFLADDGSHRVEQRAPNGSVVARFSFQPLTPSLLIGPGGVAIDRNSNVYVSDTGSGRILKLAPSGMLLAQWGAGGAAAGQFWFPGNLALDPRGQLWVDDAGNQRVQVLAAGGQFHVQFNAANASSGMALDGAGNVYLGQRLNHSVYISKFSGAGKLLARWTRLHLADLPSGIAIGPGGDIFVVGPFYFGTGSTQFQSNGENILRLASNGRQLGLFHLSAGAAGSGIAVDAQGNSYIAYGRSPRVEKRSPSGALMAAWGTADSGSSSPVPAGITLDSAGNVYVANASRSIVEEFSADGKPLSTWGFGGSYPGQFHDPRGIAVGPNGTLFVTDTGNQRIQKLMR